MKKVFLILFAVIIIGVLIISGCAKTTSTPSKTPAPATTTAATKTSTPTSAPSLTPQSGGTLKIITTEKIYNMGDPRAPGEPYDSNARHPFIETLLRFDQEPNLGKIKPWLATGWSYNADYTALTLTLQKGVKYHDGTNFNAQSVKDCLDFYKAAGRIELKSVTSVDVVDEYTVRLNTPKFDVALVGVLAQAPIGQMVSPTAMRTMDKNKLLLTPVGTGPFKLASYEVGVKIRGEKFTDYWVKGLPYLDAIEITVITDPTVARMAFERGEGDVIPRMEPKEGSELKATGKYNVFLSRSGFEFALGGDVVNADSPFANVKVRKAVAYAMNVEGAIKQLGYGIWIPNRRMWNNAHWAFNPAPTIFSYDPAKAKSLLAEAGYATGFKSTIYLRDKMFENVATVLQSNLKDVGIDVNLEVMTPAQASEQASKGWKNSIRHLLAPSTPEREPSVTALTYYGPGNLNNASMVLPADVVALCQKAASEPDFDKRKAMALEADRLVMEEYALFWEVVTAPFVVPKQRYVHDDNLRFFVGHYWTPERAWVEKH